MSLLRTLGHAYPVTVAWLVVSITVLLLVHADELALDVGIGILLAAAAVIHTTAALSSRRGGSS